MAWYNLTLDGSQVEGQTTTVVRVRLPDGFDPNALVGSTLRSALGNGFIGSQFIVSTPVLSWAATT